MVQISMTTSGTFESFDLNALPKINGLPPLQAAAEGKLQPHQLFAVLKERGVPGISASDGVQSLCVHWARFLKKQQDEIRNI